MEGAATGKVELIYTERVMITYNAHPLTNLWTQIQYTPLNTLNYTPHRVVTLNLGTLSLKGINLRHPDL